MPLAGMFQPREVAKSRSVVCRSGGWERNVWSGCPGDGFGACGSATWAVRVVGGGALWEALPCPPAAAALVARASVAAFGLVKRSRTRVVAEVLMRDARVDWVGHGWSSDGWGWADGACGCSCDDGRGAGGGGEGWGAMFREVGAFSEGGTMSAECE